MLHSSLPFHFKDHFILILASRRFFDLRPPHPIGPLSFAFIFCVAGLFLPPSFFFFFLTFYFFSPSITIPVPLFPPFPPFFAIAGKGNWPGVFYPMLFFFFAESPPVSQLSPPFQLLGGIFSLFFPFGRLIFCWASVSHSFRS